MVSYDEKYIELLSAFEIELPDYLPEQPLEQGGRVTEAARYSLLSGGKRIRPVLLLVVCEMLDVSRSAAMPFACALEMIHTYSLIHDDLPCMDNDDLRRGNPTCHKVYGEALAVLAGDALLNRAYEILLSAVKTGLNGSVDASMAIAAAAGNQGMIGGQTLDLAAEGKMIPLAELQILHQMKTGALLKAPVMAAASLAGAESRISDQLEKYASAIGLAFQIQDDILDATSDSQTMGKTVGKDQRDQKATYVSLLGIENARQQLDNTISTAHDALKFLRSIGLDTFFLEGLADFLQVRIN